MKHKLLFIGLLACSLFSCKDKGEIRIVTLSMPSSFQEEADHLPSISVWGNGVDNAEFVFSGRNADGQLEYRSKQALSNEITGNVRIVWPYSAETEYDGEVVTLRQNDVQTPSKQALYTGGNGIHEGEKAVIPMRMMTARIQLTFSNLPKDEQIVSATLRLTAKEGYSSDLFYQEATYNFATNLLKPNTSIQRSAFTTYDADNQSGTTTLYLGVFPESYKDCNLSAEIITSGGNGHNTLHVFPFEGKTFAKSQTYTYDIDFGTTHETGAAYTTDARGVVSLGLPIEIDGTTFAPVNLGYDELQSPFGLLYKTGDFTGMPYHEENPISDYCNDKVSATTTLVPTGWRLPSVAEMQKLVSAVRSEGSICGNTFGWCFSGKLYLPATGCIEEDGTSTARLQEGYYLIDDRQNGAAAQGTVLHITDSGTQVEAAKGGAYAIRLVKE